MSFLAPLFLLGALAIVAPVIFHLIRRTTRDRTVFSSLMFLLPTPPRLTRRSRLEHWLLLVLRCLALALLAFGFARPFIKQSALNDSGGVPAKRIVVLVDASASMRRADLWADARVKLESVLRSAAPADQVAVFTFGRESQPLLNFGEWKAAPPGERVALAAARFATVTPGWTGTNLGAALINAAESLADAEGEKTTGPRQIVLISDLQAGSRLDALQAYEWPKGIEVTIEPLKARYHTNAGVQLLAEAHEADSQAASTVRVRVSNAADSTREQFKVGWAKIAGGEFVGAPVETYVPPGQNRIVSLPTAAIGGAERIVLRGDDDDFDNTVFVIPPVQRKARIAYLGAEKADDAEQPLFFLQRALPSTPQLAVTVDAQPATAPLSEAAMSGQLFVVTNALPPAQAAALREQALAGKTIFLTLGNSGGAAGLGALLGVEQLAAEEARPAGYAMLAEIDFQHPLFAAFADPRYSDFTKIHFWKYRRLDAAAIPGARVLAKFDSGDPALLEVPLGKGRAFVLTAGWNPADSQFAVSSKFVPIVYALLELSGTLTPQSAHYLVGDAVAVPADWSGAITEQTPDGKTVALAAATRSFAPTTQPGIYRLAAGSRAQAVAVNLDAAESRTAPLPVEELERLGVPLARKNAAVPATVARDALLQGSATESRQKLWRWFVLATLAVLFAESLIAGRATRKPALEAGAQPGTP